MEFIETLVLLNIGFNLFLLLVTGYVMYKIATLTILITLLQKQQGLLKEIMAGQDGPPKNEDFIMTPAGPMPVSEFKKSFPPKNNDSMFG